MSEGNDEERWREALISSVESAIRGVVKVYGEGNTAIEVQILMEFFKAAFFQSLGHTGLTGAEKPLEKAHAIEIVLAAREDLDGLLTELAVPAERSYVTLYRGTDRIDAPEDIALGEMVEQAKDRAIGRLLRLRATLPSEPMEWTHDQTMGCEFEADRTIEELMYEIGLGEVLELRETLP